MSTRRMSAIQRFFTRWVDVETAAAMEAHSRAWLVQCPNCGFERSIWEIGGIRYKATGQPRTRMRCPRCGNSGWHRIYRSADFPTTKVSAWPVIRLVLVISLIATIAVGSLVLLVLKLAGVF